MTGTPPFQELLRRAAGGDRAAQDELISAFYPRVRDIVHGKLEFDFRKSHRWILPLFSTRDVVHDVFTDAIRRLDDTSFADDKAFVAYLGTIVRNRLLDAVRYHEADRRDQRLHATPEAGAAAQVRSMPDGGGTPDLAASLAEQAGIVQQVLETMPTRHRALLELRLIDEATFPVIADQLGYASAETARQAFWEAQARLLVKLRARGVRADGSG